MGFILAEIVKCFKYFDNIEIATGIPAEKAKLALVMQTMQGINEKCLNWYISEELEVVSSEGHEYIEEDMIFLKTMKMKRKSNEADEEDEEDYFLYEENGQLY